MVTEFLSLERTESAESATDEPPGPDGLPIAGSVFDFVNDPETFYEECRRTYGDVVHVNFFNRDFYILTHPADIEQVFVEKQARFEKGGYLRDQLEPVVGGTMIMSEGDRWRRRRQLAMSTFHKTKVERHVPTMARFVDQYTSSWSQGDVVDIGAEMRELTLQLVTKTLLGANVRGETDEIHEALKVINDHFWVSPEQFLPEWVPLPRGDEIEDAVEVLDDRMTAILDDRKRSDDDREDVLKFLIKAGRDESHPMSFDDVRRSMRSFVFAGYETTSLALTYAWHLLGRNTNVRQKLREEVDDVMGDGLEGSDIEKLTYTEKVIKETLRLYPPVYVLFREAQQKVDIGGYTLPPGATVMMPQMVVQRDGRFFDDPDEFRPERWTPEFEEARPEHAYFPFGGGSRHCIGMRLALTEAKVVLATVSSKFDLESEHEGPLERSYALTQQPDESVELRIEKR